MLSIDENYLDELFRLFPTDIELLPEVKQHLIHKLQSKLNIVDKMIMEINSTNSEDKIVANELREILLLLGYKFCY